MLNPWFAITFQAARLGFEAQNAAAISIQRRAPTKASGAGAQGDDDYDVIGTDGIVIGSIFKATASRAWDTLDGRWLTGNMRTKR